MALRWRRNVDVLHFYWLVSHSHYHFKLSKQNAKDKWGWLTFSNPVSGCVPRAFRAHAVDVSHSTVMEILAKDFLQSWMFSFFICFFGLQQHRSQHQGMVFRIKITSKKLSLTCWSFGPFPYLRKTTGTKRKSSQSKQIHVIFPSLQLNLWISRDSVPWRNMLPKIHTIRKLPTREIFI